MKHLVIVGGGTSSYLLAKELRKQEYSGEITIISSEPWLPYNRVLLPRVLQGTLTPVKAFFADHQWYIENNISLMRNCSIFPNTDVHNLQLKQMTPQWLDIFPSELEPYFTTTNTSEDRIKAILDSADAVVWATSGQPRIPREYVSIPSVCSWRTLEDTFTIQAHLQTQQHVTIVGGSFIGLELVMAAHHFGTPFSWVIRGSTFLFPQLASDLNRYLLDIAQNSVQNTPLFQTQVINCKSNPDSTIVLQTSSDLKPSIVTTGILLGTGIEFTQPIPKISGYPIAENHYVTGDLLQIYDANTDTWVQCGSYNQAVRANKVLCSQLLHQEVELDLELEKILHTPYQIQFGGKSIRIQGLTHVPNSTSKVEKTEKLLQQTFTYQDNEIGSVQIRT